MLAIVDFRIATDLHSWMVRDGTTDKETVIYCRCDSQEKAEMIAAALNAAWRLHEAGRLTAKVKKQPRYPEKE